MASSFKALLALAVLASSVQAGTYSGRFVSPASRNHTVVRRGGPNGFVNFGYLPNWVSGPPLSFTPSDIKADTLTHILYSFVDSDPKTGALLLSDPGADTGGNDSGALGGLLGELFEVKQKARHLKTLFSVGGWTYSQDKHFDFVMDSDARAKFVSDAVQFIEDYGFDGIDIDYEALTDEQVDGFVSLMKELRAALDKYASDKGDSDYLLTAAVGYAPAPWASQAADVMDFFNIMDYDFSGGWVSATAYQSNLYPDGDLNGGVSVDTGMTKWLDVVPGSKLTLGMPLYGHAFANTDGYNKPFSGVGANDGNRPYKDLPSSGDTVHEDLKLGASYSYDPSTKEMVAYDTPGVVKVKAQYIQDKGISGGMYWDLSTDKTGEDSLVGIVAKAFGTLDSSKNHINYPKSKYDNVKAAGAGSQTPGGGGEGTSSPPATPTETTPVPTKTCSSKRRK